MFSEQKSRDSEKNRLATFYIDGQSIGNEQRGLPRKARIAILYQPSTENARIATPKVTSEEVGDKTNNEAEYLALLRLLSLLSLEWVGPDGKMLPSIGAVQILSDSELLVKQVNGEYKVKEERLKKLRDNARELIDRVGSIVLQLIPREENYAGLWLERKFSAAPVPAEELFAATSG